MEPQPQIRLFQPPLDSPSSETAYQMLIETALPRFNITVSSEFPNAKQLEGVQVLGLMTAHPQTDWTALAGILNPDRLETLIGFIKAGGGVVILVPPQAGTPLAPFLARFGIAASPVRFGGKEWRLPPTAPVAGELTWHTEALTVLDVVETGEFGPPALLMNDRSIPPRRGPARDYPGAVMVLAKHGKGRVAAVAGADWISDPALDRLGANDNPKIMLKLIEWAMPAEK